MSKFGDLLRGGSAPAPKVEAAPAPEPVKAKESAKEKKAEKVALEELSKDELEVYGREHGVELDKRHSKKALIKELSDLETNDG